VQNESSPGDEGEESYGDESPSRMEGMDQSYGVEDESGYSHSNAHPYPKQTPGSAGHLENRLEQIK
jgi:hypothetical protein